jgi:hypothetical protein
MDLRQWSMDRTCLLQVRVWGGYDARTRTGGDNAANQYQVYTIGGVEWQTLPPPNTFRYHHQMVFVYQVTE